jgi:hypothetical protein
MPIVIKELFPSDPISEAVEKINFNFDQLLLAGGGPPGPQGPAGPPGPIGPQGTRGDHWFTGATYGGLTADHDGSSPLQVQDNFIDPNGDVWNYYDIMGSTGWTFSGINLRGPAGTGGATGGSLEWGLYLGASGNALSSSTQHWGPVPGSTTIDNGNINFIVPIGATKNTLLIGDVDWAYNNLVNWNFIQQSSGVPPSGPFLESTPRLAVIQREVDYFGVNGIQIGAYGLTGSTYSTASPLLNAIPVPTGATVDAINFFSLGIGVIGTYPKEITPQPGVPYYSHSATIKTISKDITIEAGEPSLAALSPYASLSAIRMKSNSFALQSHDGYRSIASGRRRNSVLPTVDAILTESIQINSSNGLTGGSFVSIQGIPGEAQGPVIIGKYSDSSLMWYWNGGTATPLIISKTNSWQNARGAAIVFFSENPANVNDIDAKFINVGNDLLGGGPKQGFQIATPYLSIIDITGPTTLLVQKPKFPFHVNRSSNQNPLYNGGTSYVLVDNINTIAWGGGNTWSNSITFGPGSGFSGWLAGFDKSNLFTFGAPGKGLGIGYSKVYGNTGSSGGNTDFFSSFELNLQTYWTGTPGFLSNSFYTAGNNQTITGLTGPTDAGGFMTGSLRQNPHLYMQIGVENASGNLGLGLGPSGGSAPSSGYSPPSGASAVRQIRAAWSKLSVGGSLRVGLWDQGVHLINIDNSWFSGGALFGGKVVRGLTAGSSRENFESTAFAGNLSFLANLSPGTGTAPGPTSFGISSIGRTLSDSFVARQLGNTGPMKEPAFSLPDLGTGIGQSGIAEGFLLVNPNTTGATNGRSLSAAKFANRSDILGGIETPGFKSMGVYAEAPLYVTTTDLMSYADPSIGQVGLGNASSSSTIKSWRYFIHTIPTNRSIIYFDLSAASAILWRWSSTTYSNGVAQFQSGGSYYLNNSANGSTAISSIAGFTDRRFILDKGSYDGQHVTLIFGPVDSRNEFSIFQGGPLPSLASASSLTVPDRHILAANPRYDFPRGATNVAAGNWIGAPYPFPLGATVTTSPVSGGGGGSVVGNIDYQSAWLFNWIGETMRLAPGSGIDDYGRWGKFVARPWRAITFRWVRVRPSASSNDGYSWVEINREYLSPQNLYGPQQDLQFTINATAPPSPPIGVGGGGGGSLPSTPSEVP